MKACIVTIALLACAAQELEFESTDGSTCHIKKDGSDIVGACGSDAFKSIISGDTVDQEPRIASLEEAVSNLLEGQYGYAQDQEQRIASLEEAVS
jgi:hypothetical protein